MTRPALTRIEGADGAELDARPKAGAATRRMRIEAVLRRAIVGGNADSVALLADGGGAPIVSARVQQHTDDAARDIAREVSEALEDDASCSMSVAAYRVVAMRAEETIATCVVHVRQPRAVAAAADGTVLRGAHETAEAAVLRQVMRHHEATQALAFRLLEKTSELQMKQTDRIMGRLEALEARSADFADRRRELLAAEAETEAERARQRRIDTALEMLRPHVPRLVQAVSRAALGEPPPEKHSKKHEAPAPASGEDDGQAVLGVLAGMPPEAVAMLADVLRAEGKDADAAKLLAAHGRVTARKDG